jgi:hypothetical protein
VLHQILQQVELAAGEAHRHAVDGDRDRLEIGEQAVALIASVPRLGMRAAPERGAHARGQLAETERLGDVVVGAVFEPGDAVVFAGPRISMMIGTRGRSERAQHPADLEAADHQQVEVEDDEIRNSRAPLSAPRRPSRRSARRSRCRARAYV